MKNHEFDLVRSTYPVCDAKDVLLSLMNDKIKFLNCKIFSLEERFGSAPPHLRERVDELKAKKNQLVEILNACDEDQLVEIDCQIVFNIKDKATDEVSYQKVSADLRS